MPDLSLYQAIAENLPHGAAFLVGQDFKYWLAGGAALQAAGLTSSDFVNKSIFEVIEPDLVDQAAADYSQALSGIPFAREHKSHGRYFMSHGIPLKTEGNAVYAALVVSYDITHRKRTEEDLKFIDQIGEATHAAESAQDVMSITTRMLGEYLDVTRCAYADVEFDNDRFTIRHDWRVPGTDSTVGEYSLSLFGSLAVSKLRAGNTLVVNDVDHELAADDGGGMFNAIGIKAIVCCPFVKNGTLVAMMAVHHSDFRAWTDNEIRLIKDIAERCWVHIERVRAAESLREADRNKDQFLATLAHEMRNPLATLANSLHLLRTQLPDSVSTTRVIDGMDRQINHMVTLINDLLDVSKIKEGKIILKKRVFPVSESIAMSCDIVRSAINERKQNLRIDPGPRPFLIHGDPVRITQVVTNILTNASKFTPVGGDIALEVTPENGEVVIVISDNGIGIPKDKQSHIFDMFSQLDQRLSTSQSGLGIGLSLARQIVELHSGTISAHSEGVDSGSTFSVRLPEVEPAKR